MNSHRGKDAGSSRLASPIPVRSGFSLIELLIVVTIIAFLFAMIVFLPKGMQRDNAVRAAAEELASTLRLARSYAMNQRSVCGVAFNIQNAPGTSGRVLNNNSGGHWYRIVGASTNPTTTDQLAVYPYPVFDGDSGRSTVARFLSDVQTSWIGDRHVLAQYQVRFLALTDQDNGTGIWGNAFPATYPRPWFGYWDPTTKRLYPWGGYDPTVVDTGGRKSSGFYYEGNDGTITNCINPSDRTTTYTGTSSLIFKKDAGRPLVNGNWLDYAITFLPDGTACASPCMLARKKSYEEQSRGGGPGATGKGDLGDLSAYPGVSWPNSFQDPMTDYFRHTGLWSITLCPDDLQDTDSYPTAQTALASIWPAYRVTINQFGIVKVVQVTKLVPNGTVFDTTISNWQAWGQVGTYYQGDIATTASGALRGYPVTRFLNEKILASRQWWMVGP